MTARDLQGRISITWVTSLVAELVSKSPAIILFEERHPPLLGMGQQICSLRCTCTTPALHWLSVCSGTLNSSRTSPPWCSAAVLPYLCISGRSKSFPDWLREPCALRYAAPVLTRCLHSPRLILCLSQDISSMSWGNFRGIKHNKNMARILWCNEKTIAGQDSSHLAMDGTKQTSKPS